MHQPTGLQRRRLLWGASALWCLAWGIVALVGALSALQPFSLGADYALHDTYYVVAHWYWVLSFGSIFAVFAIVYLCFEKILGVKPKRLLGAVHLGATLMGVAMSLYPQLFLRLQGMPDRYVDYAPTFAFMSGVMFAGYLIIGAGFVAFGLVVIEALMRRRRPMAT